MYKQNTQTYYTYITSRNKHPNFTSNRELSNLPNLNGLLRELVN